MDFGKAKWFLALEWFGICGILFLVVFLQTIFNKFGDRSDEVWSWLLPNIMPVLTMIAGVLIADAKSTGQTRKVGIGYYLFAAGLSGFYLLLILLIVFLGPLVAASSGLQIFDMIERTGILLGPLQGVAASALGIFFLKKSDAPEPAAAPSPQADDVSGPQPDATPAG